MSKAVSLYVDILDAPHLAGPYKLTALDALQTVATHGMLHEVSSGDEGYVTGLWDKVVLAIIK